ncbi:hypothetical protein F5144DRAFT_617471 [Chaetomium tenue]|uniref:Uncharacterized protein n=1 Tax=Chaetomium tenue TaxID=1854479 RepID=A0ACB7PN74_9PEZI|nr:hypothetical protein F5144DRAFT_617471 [Chaetomium globosum]
MAAAATKNIQLALALPTRLRTFLARYPPASILPAGADPETHKTGYQEDTPNPFRPLRHPVTGKWHDPKYSLRRQAELVKMARKHGVEELLPEGPKSTEVRLRKRVELGLRVKGTGVGQKVKGHKHERQLGVKYDGQEETGHVGHAGPHQGMEEGPFYKTNARDWLQILLTLPPKVRTNFSLQHHQLAQHPTPIQHPHTAKEAHLTMTPSNPNPTYYEILNLSPTTLTTQEETGGEPAAAALIKRAYRRALLNHHPDKKPHPPHHHSHHPNNPPSTTHPHTYTIDQISTAYATLSRRAQRQAYDTSLLLLRQQQSHSGAAGGGTGEAFQTGIETIDLDDLECDEGEGGDGGETQWYRSCRCGNPRGYYFTEADLEDAADLGEVCFAVVEENGDDVDAGGVGRQEGSSSGSGGKGGTSVGAEDGER